MLTRTTCVSECSETHLSCPGSLLASFMSQRNAVVCLCRSQIYMKNLQESPLSPAWMTPPSRRALPFPNKGTLMQNSLSPPKGTVFQGHTKRKALSICLAQRTRLTRQLRNSPRCLLASSVYPNQRRRRKRRKRAGDIAPNSLVSARGSHGCVFRVDELVFASQPPLLCKPENLALKGGWQCRDGGDEL